MTTKPFTLKDHLANSEGHTARTFIDFVTEPKMRSPAHEEWVQTGRFQAHRRVFEDSQRALFAAAGAESQRKAGRVK
jgi:hypothetical protein